MRLQDIVKAARAQVLGQWSARLQAVVITRFNIYMFSILVASNVRLST